jgi:hypothetical protein
MSSSASNENARKCLVHFFLPPLAGLFSFTTAPPRFLRLLAQKKNNSIPAITATTMGTATAAWRADEQEILLQDDSLETVTAPLVLLAALVAVLEAELLVTVFEAAADVMEADVEKVVGVD